MSSTGVEPRYICGVQLGAAPEYEAIWVDDHWTAWPLQTLRLTHRAVEPDVISEEEVPEHDGDIFDIDAAEQALNREGVPQTVRVAVRYAGHPEDRLKGSPPELSRSLFGGGSVPEEIAGGCGSQVGEAVQPRQVAAGRRLPGLSWTYNGAEGGT